MDKKLHILRPKSPLRSTPITNKLMPTKKWLFFPMVGTKGLPTALSQTSCSDDSISFELIEMVRLFESAA
jgi:hypothetical protein